MTMPPSTRTLASIEQHRVALRAEVARVGAMRPGSLVARYRRCGKPGCHCARTGAVGHGPSWSLTHAVAGKTVTRIIPAAAVATTQQHLAEYRRFRDLVRALVVASEQACEAHLATAGAADEAAEKGGSRRRSRRPSSPNSTR
jgi:hypothetical protein